MNRRLTSIAISLCAVIGLSTAAPAHAVSHTPDSGGYILAMGDSVAAGLGLAATGEPADATCGRSTDAYAAKLAAERGMAVTNLACSRARVWDGLLTDQESVGVPGQLREASSLPAPDAITMTIGANDVGWAYWLRYCAAYNCGSSSDLAFFQALERKLGFQLWSALAWSQALGSPRVFVTGYSFPLAGCSATNGIDDSEIAWLSARFSDLNARIQREALLTGSTFVPVDFGDRGICSTNSLIQRQGDAAPFHPTAEGQQVIAAAIAANWDSSTTIVD